MPTCDEKCPSIVKNIVRGKSSRPVEFELSHIPRRGSLIVAVANPGLLPSAPGNRKLEHLPSMQFFLQVQLTILSRSSLQYSQ